MMEWIQVNSSNEIPQETNVIVEDCNGWIGQAYYNGSAWVLETFNQTISVIEFGNIVRYFIID